MELLSYGDQVKVLEPTNLQKQIDKQLKSALKNY
jgi:predicted DNA-binding transcriptional regulator YafY